MSSAARYAGTGFGVVALSVLALWPFLDPAGRRGVLIAASVALPVQAIAFAALVRYRGRGNGFLVAWIGGMVLRVLVLGAVAFLAIWWGTEGAIPMLLALAGFFFGLLLLEPVFFRPGPDETAQTTG